MIPPDLVAAAAETQSSIVALANRDIVAAWRGVDTRDGVAARRQIGPVVRDVVAAYGELSAVAAADFYDQSRSSAGAAGTFRAAAARPAGDDQIDAMTRWAVGPLFDGDAATALSKLSGGTSRLVRQAERDTVWESALRDPARPRYARVPRPDACPFCLMLASRGGVYPSSSAERQYHDFCGCTAQAVWSDDDLQPVHRRLADEWDRVTAGADDPVAVWNSHHRT